MRKKKLYVIGYYVIGYNTDNDPACGKQDGVGYQNVCWPMTATQAKRELKHYDPDAIIYKLVPVSPEEI